VGLSPALVSTALCHAALSVLTSVAGTLSVLTSILVFTPARIRGVVLLLLFKIFQNFVSCSSEPASLHVMMAWHDMVGLAIRQRSFGYVCAMC
jgi:hypothetical protein